MASTGRLVKRQDLSRASSSFQLKDSKVEANPSPENLEPLWQALGRSLIELQIHKDDVCASEEFNAFASRLHQPGVDPAGSQTVDAGAVGKLKDSPSFSSQPRQGDSLWDTLSNLSSDLGSLDESEQTAVMVSNPGDIKGYDMKQNPPSMTRWPSCVVAFVVEPDKDVVLAHREIVAARCPQLLAQVTGTGNGGSSVLVDLLELTKPGIWACLNFIYTGGIHFAAEDAWDVFQAASYLSLELLVDSCTQMILESVTEANVWAMLEGGVLLESQGLIDTAVEMIAKKTKAIVSRTDFTSPSVTAGALLKVVERSDLTIYEKDLANVIVSQWMNNTSEPKEVVDEVLRHISWPQVYEEDMELLSVSMRKMLLPNDVVAEVTVYSFVAIWA